MDFRKILAILAALAAVPGIPFGATAAAGAMAIKVLTDAFTKETGKTKEQFFLEAGLVLDAAEMKLLDDLAKGE